MSDEDILSEEESEEVQEEIIDEQPEKKAKQDKWDKDRQRVDQLQANLKKMAEEKNSLTEQFTAISDSLAAKIEALESRLAEKQEIREDQIKLDPELYDPKLLKTIETLQKELVNAKSAMTQYDKQLRDLNVAKEQTEAAKILETENVKRLAKQEEILSSLDEEYGAKFRNAAIKLAQGEVDETGTAPEGELAVYKLLRKHYAALKADVKPTKEKPNVRLDSGTGGVTFGDGEVKEGSRTDVLKQIVAKYKGKGFSMPKN